MQLECSGQGGGRPAPGRFTRTASSSCHGRRRLPRAAWAWGGPGLAAPSHSTTGPRRRGASDSGVTMIRRQVRRRSQSPWPPRVTWHAPRRSCDLACQCGTSTIGKLLMFAGKRGSAPWPASGQFLNFFNVGFDSLCAWFIISTICS